MSLELEGRLDLVHLELNDRVVLVVVFGVVVGENRLGLSDFPLGEEPSRGLGDEPEHAKRKEESATRGKERA